MNTRACGAMVSPIVECCEAGGCGDGKNIAKGKDGKFLINQHNFSFLGGGLSQYI